ncbi:NAD(P)/FAD-dependent oxidoreductase [Streptomyces fimicarius]|uniref:NAD(P)/FAD-dependent oxidoreductase n=1 Tax=Streptomyces griseus TaxID=1911 RepID=UPI0036D1CF8C
MDDVREVIVIGSGPAGYTAALYTARAQLRPLLFGSSIFVGGSLTTTTEVENFPGFPTGIDGPDLMDNMRAQAERFGAEMIDDDIVSVDLTGDIKEVTDSEIAEIKAENGMLAGVVLRDTFTGRTRDLDATGLFIAIGHDPRTELFTGQVDLDHEGYIKVEAPSTRTNLPGVFAAGDVVDHTYRQAITAAGSGCQAALDAERYLAALADKRKAAASVTVAA